MSSASSRSRRTASSTSRGLAPHDPPEEHAMGERLTRDMMAARITAEFQDGWIANLGVGMPTMGSDFLPADKMIILHSENGLIGYGRKATVEGAAPCGVNAGVLPVMLALHAALVRDADAVRGIRGGH